MMVPYAVVRANNLPLRALDGLTSSGAVEAVAGRIAQLERTLSEQRAIVCDALYARAAREPNRYRDLIDLKRRVFKGGSLQQLLLKQGELLSSLPEAALWLDAARQWLRHDAELEELFDQQLTAARRQAQTLASNELFLNATTFARGRIVEAAIAYAGADRINDKKALNDEETVFRYLTRAIAKVSPFSSFTSVGFAPLLSAAPPTVMRNAELASRYSHDRSSLLKLFDRFVVRHRSFWRFRLTANVTMTSSQQFIYLFIDRVDIYPYRTSYAKTGIKSTARGLYESMSAGWTSWAAIDALMPKHADSVGILEKWIASGMLNYAPRLDDQAGDLLKQFLIVAQRIAEEDADAQCVAQLLQHIDECCNRLEDTHAASRRTLIEQINTAFTALGAALGMPLVKASGFVYHDSHLPALGGLDSQRVETLAVQIEEFLHHHLGYRHSSSFSGQALVALRSQFPTDQALDVFAFNELFEGVRREHAGSEPLASTPMLQLYAEVWRRRDEHTIRFPRIELPEGHRGRSFCAYGHVLNENFVLNNVDSGYLRCFSRFLTFTKDTEVLRACRQAYAGELDAAYDFYDTFGFNTACRPRISGRRIWLDRVMHASEGDTTLSDLQIVWPEQQPYPTLQRRDSGAPVQLRHTALCVSSLYPRLLENLLLIATPEDACYFAFRFGVFKQLANEAPPGVVRVPRVLYGDIVLSREQWWVPRSMLPLRDKGEAVYVYFRRLDAWRRGVGLPQRAFARRHQLDKVLERDISNLKKPMLVDFSSPIMSRMVGRIFSSGFDYLSLEEMLPDHTHSFVSDGTDNYANEIIIEQAGHGATSARRGTV